MKSFNAVYAALLMAALAGSAGRLEAQVSGTVVGSSGAPLAGALVDLWAGDTRVGTTTSLSDGRFRVGESAGSDLVLIVRLIGYQMRRLAVAGDQPVPVVLQPVAIALAPLTVTGTSHRCPQRDDAVARRLWTAMALRYHPSDSRGLESVNAVASVAIVRADQLGAIDTTQLRPAAVGRGTPSFISARIATRGYSWPRDGIGSPGWFDLWEYPLLESTDAHHFADSIFGALNTLRLVSVDSVAGYLITFCSRRAVPGIEGALEIGPDTMLRSADWLFRTARPIEEAGGRVAFAAPTARDGSDVAVPVVGTFWRKRIFDYLQTWWEFRGWTPLVR